MTETEMQMIRIIYTTPRSVTLDINDGGKYHSKNAYKIELTAVKRLECAVSHVSVDNYEKHRELKDDRSIVSIFDLEPDTVYDLRLKSENGTTEDISFTTEHETMTVNVREVGAYGDGEHDDTAFIMSAIMICPKDGRVLIPEGTYRHTGIYLKSDMRVELAKGARLVFDKERLNIPRFPAHLEGSTGSDGYFLGTWEGEPQAMFNASVCAIGVTNSCIYGEGTLDGNASKDDWWKDPKQIRIAARPRMFFTKNSENVALQGITLTNSPAWTVHPFFSKTVGFYNITIRNPWDSPNTDGIDPESCDGVEIAGVHFSLGDDCIAVKSGKIEMGRMYRTPCQNIHIYGCLMEDGHGAVTVGSEAAAGVKELIVERCDFCRTDRGLRVKTRRGRGKDSVMDNIVFRDIDMDGVVTPFVVNSFYYCDSDGKTDYVQDRNPLPVDDRTPVIRRLVFENIHAVNSHYAAGWIEGLPEQPIEEIVLHDIYVGFALDARKGIPAMACNVPECSREGFIVKNVVHIDEKNVIIEK